MAGTILLIDDDADDRELFCEALTDITSKIRCDAISNGQKAFLQLEQQEPEFPELIFLDINMPALNGWECLKKLKESAAYRHIPVIMYSTSSYPEEIRKAGQLGALCFFSKPTDYEQLKTSLKLVIDCLMNKNLSSLSKKSTVFLTH